MTLPAYVLAGGRSSRFGSDKARAVVDGAPLVVHAARSVAGMAHETSVVARSPGAYADLGLRTIADRLPDRGPLGGLEAALADAYARAGGDTWVLVTACDWVGFRPAWMASLAAAIPDDRASNPARVVAFRGERWEPLPALYHTRLRALVAERLVGEERALWRLIEAVPARAVSLPPDWASARQLNRPGG